MDEMCYESSVLKLSKISGNEKENTIHEAT